MVLTLERRFLRNSRPPRWFDLARPYCSKETTTTTGGTTSTTSDSAAADSTTNESDQISEAEEQLRRDIEDLRARHDDLLDKYKRSIAESDNMRKRLTKQIDDAKVFGIQSFVKDLLEVADVLQRASAGVDEETLRESAYLNDVVSGVRLTEAQLHQVFRRHGLEKMEPLGEKFDPNFHEALFQVPAPDKEPNTVVDVQSEGYVLHGRTVRPAKVGVSKK